MKPVFNPECGTNYVAGVYPIHSKKFPHVSLGNSWEKKGNDEEY